jgi:hypothetical protein
MIGVPNADNSSFKIQMKMKYLDEMKDIILKNKNLV